MLGRRDASVLLVALLGAASTAGGACAGHHGGLAASGGAAATSSTGAGGAGGGGGKGASSSSSSTSSSASGSSSSGAGGADSGPPGPTRLTVIDGVNDYPAVRICFTAYPAGPDVQPWPQDSAGLPFARGAALDLAGSAFPGGVDVRPVVVAGDLASTSGLGCAAILALPPPGDAGGGVVVAPLPVVPAAVFSSGKSLLLVPTGCVGGPGHTDPQQTFGCGMDYTPDAPNPGLIVLGMNRLVDPARVALQAVHASAALPAVDLRVTPGIDASAELQIASNLSYGEDAPSPPFTTLAASDYGMLAKLAFKTYSPGTMYATSITPGSDVLDKGNVKSSDFTNGGGFALVAVGGYPGVAAGPWWHALTYALVRTDP